MEQHCTGFQKISHYVRRTLRVAKIWILASRPQTLPAAVAPVVMGTAMAYGDGKAHFLSAFMCAFCAVMIQIGTNLANDYYDFKKGVDTAERVGPTRITQAGLASPSSVRYAFVIVFLIAIMASFYLVWRAGMPIVVIGIISIASGVFYTAGPRPLGYMGFGELFVLVFFGPIAVAGTYYAQSLQWDFSTVLAGFGVGFLSVALLAVNNYRDMLSDRKTGKRTLAVRFGPLFGRSEYVFCVLMSAFVPVVICWRVPAHPFLFISTASLLLALPLIRKINTYSDGQQLNDVLARTGQLTIVYSILFSIGWVLP